MNDLELHADIAEYVTEDTNYDALKIVKRSVYLLLIRFTTAERKEVLRGAKMLYSEEPRS